jgi:surface protein
MINKFIFSITWLLCIVLSAKGQDDFVTLWDLSKSGNGHTQISFYASGTEPGGKASYTWETLPAGASGSGQTAATVAGVPTLTTLTGLPANAIIKLSIKGTINRFSTVQMIETLPSVDKSKLIDVLQWGTANWKSCIGMFYEANNLTHVSATDVPDFSNVKSMYFMFAGCNNLATVPNMNQWNTSTVTDMLGTFYACTRFNENISNWNTANVTTMYDMFQGAARFNQNIGQWNTGKVTQMEFMFKDASAFNQDLSAWDVANVDFMGSMFLHAGSFNQNLAAWAPQFSNHIDLSNFLDSSGLSINNYDITLTAFNALAPNGIDMGHAHGLLYQASKADRANLIKPITIGGKGWKITGDATTHDGGIVTTQR